MVFPKNFHPSFVTKSDLESVKFDIQYVCVLWKVDSPSAIAILCVVIIDGGPATAE